MAAWTLVALTLVALAAATDQIGPFVPPMSNPLGPPMPLPQLQAYTLLRLKRPLRIPRSNAQCPVHAVEALKPGGGEGESFLEVEQDDEEGGGGGSSPQDVLKHVGKYAGLQDLQDTPKGARALLKVPDNIVFKRVAKHYFSCVDPRSEYAVLGTLGGDVGEWIIALSAMEKMNRRKYTEIDVNSLLQDYLRLMVSRGKQWFYMHTDEAAVKALAEEAKVKDAMKPANPAERNRILALVAKPDYLGCQHLKGMVEDAGSYGVRKELAEWTIQSYINIYFDVHNPLTSHLLYVVSKGEAVKAPVSARIWSPDDCVGLAPTLVPNTGKSKVAIHHKAHVEFYRQDLARFFAFRNAEVDPADLLKEIARIAKMQEDKISVYTEGGHVDVVFKSATERWPF